MENVVRVANTGIRERKRGRVLHYRCYTYQLVTLIIVITGESVLQETE